jgi:hypothetical protein
MRAYGLAIASTWRWFRGRAIVLQLLLVLTFAGAPALFGWFLVGRQAAAPEEPPAITRYVVREVPLRALPRAGDDVDVAKATEIDTLQRGETVTLLETRGEFSVILDSIGAVGYLQSSALSPQPPPIGPQQPFTRCTRRRLESDTSGCAKRAEEQAAACLQACEAASSRSECVLACDAKKTECVKTCEEPPKPEPPPETTPPEPNATASSDSAAAEAADAALAAESPAKRRKRKGRRKKKKKKRRKRSVASSSSESAFVPADIPIPLPEEE